MENRFESEIEPCCLKQYVLFVRVDGSGHAESIQNVFDDFICSEFERMD